MANARPCLAQLSKLCLSARPSVRPSVRPHLPIFAFQPCLQSRSYAAAKGSTNKNDLAKQKNKKKGDALKKKRKPRNTYIQYDLKNLQQYSLCDAMRYLRAAEVGRPPTQSKYEIAVKLKSVKNGPVIRNRVTLPHPVKTDVRVCVICPSDSEYAVAARSAGATLVGEEEVFQAVKEGRVEFDRCLCQADSLQKLNGAGLGRILGPKGLMPSAKTGTVIKDPAAAVRDMVGAAEYRERIGVIRMAVGQLGFTPEQVQRNIKVFVENVKKDIGLLNDRVNKEIAEIVLSSTNGPGLSLSGTFIDADSTITVNDLSSG